MKYQRLSVREKEQYARGIREPAIACPRCEVQTTPTDLLEHIDERCQGARDPHHAAKWVTRAEALALGVPRETLHRWARRGLVRHRGLIRSRRYLLRDVARLLALRSAMRPTRGT